MSLHSDNILSGVLQRFHIVVNFIAHHHSQANRQAHERHQLDEAIQSFKDEIMQAFNDAVASAKARADALQTTVTTQSARITELEATATGSSAVQDAVAAATAGMIPEQMAVDAVNTIAPAA